MTKLFDISIIGDSQGALDFITNLLQASTEYSIIGKDLKGKILLWNEGARRLYGYEPEEVIGKMTSTTLHTKEDVKSQLPQKMMEVALKRGKWQGTVTRVRKNGSKFTAQVVLTPQFDPQGKPIGFLLISKDISEELRVMNQLNYTRSLVESNIDALIITDPLGIITDVNQQIETMSEFSRKDLIGSPIAKYFMDPQIVEESINKILKEKKLIQHKLVLRNKSKKEIPIFYRASVLEDSEGKLQGILITIQDSTEQEIIEEKFQRILEATPDAMVMINQEGKILFINTQTEKLFGYTKAELLGQFVEILIPEPYRGRHPEHRQKYFESPHVRPMGIGMELYGLRKTGEQFPIEISLSPFGSGENRTALAAVRDITDRKFFEHTLQEKNIELENANLAKDRFLASMSHELRTPLNAIIGFTGTMLMKLPGPLNQEQEKQLKIVQTSARHLLSLINDLLDLAKIESGNVELNFEQISCQSIIEEVASNLIPIAENKGISFKVKMPQKAILINMDRRALTQIIINLANNAIKFTEKGEVKVELNKIKKGNEGFIIIKVIDTGIGIKKEDQEKLFHAFRQMASPAMGAEGTGLGLHVSQKLATALSSKILFKSEYGKGSCFSIQLPMG